MTDMTTSNRAVVTLPEPTQILITREFDAPPASRLPGLDDTRADQALVERGTRRGHLGRG